MIDFAPTRRMVSDGTLLMTAELQRLQRLLSSEVRIRCSPPHNVKVAQVLEQIGVYQMLRFRSNVKPRYGDVVHWKYAHGHGAEGEKYDEILGHYDGVIPPELSQGFYLGLTEAMTNAQQHAYLETRQDELGERTKVRDWWMFSQLKDARLTVVFCDLGIGIPNSLPRQQPGMWGRIRARLGVGAPEADIIREAIRERRTRTKKHYRGKGLQQLVSVIDNIDDGRLIIYSNHGCYGIRAQGEYTQNFRDSILGTLITWSVPFDLPEHAHGNPAD